MFDPTNIPDPPFHKAPTTKEQAQLDFQEYTQSQLDEIKEVLAEQTEILEAHRQWQEKQELVQTDILELYKNIKGFLTVLGWFERFAIFIGKIAVAGGLLWVSFKFLIKETLHK